MNEHINRACPINCNGNIEIDLLAGFDEWFEKRGYAADCPSDRQIAKDAWKAARGLKYYPCDRCEYWRTEEEGGTIFTVCAECWNKK